MKRAVIQFSTFLILFVVVMVVRFPYHHYGLGLFDSLRESLRQQGIMLEAEQIRFDFPAQVRFDNLSLVLPYQQTPIPLQVQRAVINPEILSLFFLQGVLGSSIAAYEGSLESRINYSLLSKDAELEFSAKDLQLAAHPLLKAHGVSGILRLRGNAQLASQGAAENKKPAQLRILGGQAELQLEGASYHGNYKVQGLIPIPKLDDVRSELKLRHRNERTNIEMFQLFSSLGEITADGSLVTHPNGNIKTCSISGKISLTATGEKEIAGYLALAAGLSPDRSSRDWSFTFEKRSGTTMPLFKAKPL